MIKQVIIAKEAIIFACCCWIIMILFVMRARGFILLVGLVVGVDIILLIVSWFMAVFR